MSKSSMKPANITVGVRISVESKELLSKLTEMVSDELGTKVTLGQTVEIALKEAYDRRMLREQ